MMSKLQKLWITFTIKNICSGKWRKRNENKSKHGFLPSETPVDEQKHLFSTSLTPKATKMISTFASVSADSAIIPFVQLTGRGQQHQT